jgi:flagellar assembly protein FliH
VRLALAMATHVLRRQVEVDPELLVSMARAALERLASASAVTIHVHPTDFEALSRQHPPAAASGSVEVIADPDVPRGGCVARTAGGTIDAGIDAQFSELTTALLGRHDERDRV